MADDDEPMTDDEYAKAQQEGLRGRRPYARTMPRSPEYNGRWTKGQMPVYCEGLDMSEAPAWEDWQERIMYKSTKYCHRVIPDGEPVWRFTVPKFKYMAGPFSVGANEKGTVCKDCAARLKRPDRPAFVNFEGRGRLIEAYSPEVDIPKPCVQCARKVFFRFRWSEEPMFPEHVLCSDKCKSAYWARIARDKRHVAREPIQCAACPTEFTPKRTDALYCSPACKQWAYRKRRAAP